MANQRSSRCDCRRCIAKPGKRHRQRAKQRRYAMAPPVLQMAFSAAGRAARPLQSMAHGLCGNDRSSNAGQKLLRFGQAQSQVSNIAKTFRTADLYQIGARAAGIIPCRNQSQHPSYPRSPGRLSTRPTVPPVSSYPHSLDTPPSQADIHTGGRIVEQQDYPHCTCPGPAVAYSPSLSWRLGPPGSQAPATPPNTVAPFVLVPLPSAWPPCSRGRRWCPPAVPTTRAALLRNPAPQSRSVARRNRSAVRSHDGRQSSD